MHMGSGSGNIPDELLENIGNRLNTKTDVSRFRAVCKLWRSSIPPFKKNLLQFPTAQIHFEDDDTCQSYTLVESKVYHLAPPADDPQKMRRGCLINVQEVESGETDHILLRPLSRSHRRRKLPKSFPKVLNLSDIPALEVANMYGLRASDEERFAKFKVAASLDLDIPAFMVIGDHRTLYYGKLGGHVINCINVSEQLDAESCDFEDVIVHQGKFCAVCDDGRALAFDSCFNWKLIASPLANHSYDGHKKHLVESMGDLLLVDRHSDYNYRCETAGHRFRIFKLEANEKKWVELGAEALDDRILMLGDDGCYFVSSRDFPGCKGRSIYFNEPWYEKSYKHELARMLSRIGVFSLDSGSSSILRLADLPSSENMFCPQLGLGQQPSHVLSQTRGIFRINFRTGDEDEEDGVREKQ